MRRLHTSLPTSTLIETPISFVQPVAFRLNGPHCPGNQQGAPFICAANLAMKVRMRILIGSLLLVAPIALSGACSSKFVIEPPPSDDAGVTRTNGKSRQQPSEDDPEVSRAEPRPGDEVADPSATRKRESCETPGAYRCISGSASSRESCGDDGFWSPSEPCSNDQTCVGTGGECTEQDEICMAKQGQHVCIGATMYRCNEVARPTEAQDCGDPRRCELGLLRGQCAVCIPGDEYRCDGADLMVCEDDGKGYRRDKACASADLCNADAQDCTDAVCTPNQVRCDGQQLLECNAQQTTFDLIETCSDGDICDPAGKQCDPCVPGTEQCTEGKRERCASDGQRYEPTPCPANASHCGGIGLCYECTEDSHCQERAATCQVATCSRLFGTCSVDPAPGDDCPLDGGGTGLCTRDAACVQCINNDDCATSEECSSGKCIARGPYCGDGAVNNLEICDPAEPNVRDLCSSSCKMTDAVYASCSTPGPCFSGRGTLGQAVFCGAVGACTAFCQTDAQCQTDGKGRSARCLTGPDGLATCVIACTSASDCPNGLGCHTLSLNGTPHKMCGLSDGMVNLP